MSYSEIGSLRETGECTALMDACTPSVYMQNAFRITGLHVDVTAREIKRRIDDLKAAEEFGDADDEHSHAFALKPSPTLETIRDAAQRLQDPERRIVEELFWFWPMRDAGAAADGALAALAEGNRDYAFRTWAEMLSEGSDEEIAIAKHNLAVFYHLVALDSEQCALDNALDTDQLDTIEEYWQTCFNWWEDLTDDEVFWSLVSARIRRLDDPRLTTGFARRMRRTLPEAMDNINARLAINFIEREKYDLADKHIAYMIQTHVGLDNVPKTMSIVTRPLFTRIRVALDQAEIAAGSHAINAGSAALNLLNISCNSMEILGRFLPEDHTELNDVRDAIIRTCLRCLEVYVRETKEEQDDNWDTALNILEKLDLIAITKETKDSIGNARDEVLREKDLSHPKIGVIRRLIIRTSNENLPQKIKTFGSEIARSLYDLGSEVGSQSETYILASDLIAGSMRAASVDVINMAQEKLDRILTRFEDESFRSMHEVALLLDNPNAKEFERRKWDAISELSVGVDLFDQGRKLAQAIDLKERFDNDLKALFGIRDLCSKVSTLHVMRRERGLLFNWWTPSSGGAGTTTSTTRKPSSSSSSSSSSGCFIATAVYGSYDHPSVVVLRKFRDLHLSKTSCGCCFIRFYYKVGPALALLVSRHDYLRRFCNTGLDALVNFISRKLVQNNHGL